jgi:oligoribonuclease
MTGLDLARDALIEVAAIVTDAELVPIDDGLDVIIHVHDDVLDSMVPIVRDMHASSGLTDQVRSSTITLGEAERAILDYVRRHVPEPRTAPLCGNSIATDRGFLARDMPDLDAHLHYRMVDVSSLKELADIRESIQELAFYRRTLFVPLPGPSSEDAQAAARAILGDASDPVD